MRVRLFRSAKVELDDAIAYYEAQQPGLGVEFAAEVQLSLASIKEFPHGWPRVGERVRRYSFARFPYSLIYAPLVNAIALVAVMHSSRRPGYWRKRLSEL